ncbi:MAG: lipopolysaccharide transport periplasmic protein LptA [Acidiferrobacterales bacterium]
MLSLSSPLTSGGEKPIYLRADNITVDQRTGQSTYRGNVYLKRGGFSFTADTALVKQRNSRIEKLTASGTPIVARKIDPPGNILTTVKGQRLLYLAKSNKVIMTGNVITRRGSDVIRSAKVTYKIDENTIVAEGLGESARVHALFQVKSLSPLTPDREKSN